MNKNRNWTVLLIGGASGTGKSSIAYELGRFYNVNVMEVDDVCQAIKVMTTIEAFPAIHYFSTGINWKDIGVGGNLKWLIDVSQEIAPGLRAIVENHIEAGVPIIIEGDFIHPDFMVSFEDEMIKKVYINEPDKEQILQNYLAREGGELQNFRADVSAAYGEWLKSNCIKLDIKAIEPRPWETLLDRIIEALD